MRKYQITDFELSGKKIIVEAPGVAEAMFEYLPWPTLDINVSFSTNNGYDVIDMKTDFKYYIKAV